MSVTPAICRWQIAMMIFGHFCAQNGGFKAAKSNLCDEKTCFFIELAHCKCDSPFLSWRNQLFMLFVI